MMAMISSKGRTSPSRPYNTIKLLGPMLPLQGIAPEGKPSSTYGKGEPEKGSGR